MLVDEHAEGDAACEEAVQEVLHIAADEGVEAELLLVLNDPLGQGGDHVVVTVTDIDQELQEAAKGWGEKKAIFTFYSYSFCLCCKKTVVQTSKLR